MRILVDMDGIIVNFNKGFVRSWNRTFPDRKIRIEDINQYDIHKAIGATSTEICDILAKPYFFDHLEPMPGAIEALLRMEKEAQVHIATAPFDGNSARAKVEWIQRHLGWGIKRIHFTHNKDWIDADVLVDDKPANIRSWLASDRFAIGIAWPYNREVRDHLVPAWNQSIEAWKEIELKIWSLL